MATYYSTTEVQRSAGALVVLYVVRILVILLAFRFFLRLFGANPGAGFTDFIYDASRPFVAPFANVFQVTTSPAAPGSAFEWTTLLAMLVYWIIGALLMRLFSVAQPTVVREAHAYDEDEDDVV